MFSNHCSKHKYSVYQTIVTIITITIIIILITIIIIIIIIITTTTTTTTTTTATTTTTITTTTTFILIQEIDFTESLLNWKTSTGPSSAQLPFFYVITQTLEPVNVDLELDYLHLLKTNFNNYT